MPTTSSTEPIDGKKIGSCEYSWVATKPFFNIDSKEKRLRWNLHLFLELEYQRWFMEKVVAIDKDKWTLNATNLGVSSYCCCCKYTGSENFEILAWDQEAGNLKWINVYDSFNPEYFVPNNYKMKNPYLLAIFLSAEPVNTLEDFTSQAKVFFSALEKRTKIRKLIGVKHSVQCQCSTECDIYITRLKTMAKNESSDGLFKQGEQTLLYHLTQLKNGLEGLTIIVDRTMCGICSTIFHLILPGINVSALWDWFEPKQKNLKQNEYGTARFEALTEKELSEGTGKKIQLSSIFGFRKNWLGDSPPSWFFQIGEEQPHGIRSIYGRGIKSLRQIPKDFIDFVAKSEFPVILDLRFGLIQDISDLCLLIRTMQSKLHGINLSYNQLGACQKGTLEFIVSTYSDLKWINVANNPGTDVLKDAGPKILFGHSNYSQSIEKDREVAHRFSNILDLNKVLNTEKSCFNHKGTLLDENFDTDRDASRKTDSDGVSSTTSNRTLVVLLADTSVEAKNCRNLLMVPKPWKLNEYSSKAISNQDKKWCYSSIQNAATEMLKSENIDKERNRIFIECKVIVIESLEELQDVEDCVGLAIIGHGSVSTIGQLKIFDIGMAVCKHQENVNKYPLLLFSCVAGNPRGMTSVLQAMVECCIVAPTSLVKVNTIQNSIIYNCFQSLRFYSSYSDSSYFWNLVAGLLKTPVQKYNNDVFFNDKFVESSGEWHLGRLSNNGSHFWKLYAEHLELMENKDLKHNLQVFLRYFHWTLSKDSHGKFDGNLAEVRESAESDKADVVINQIVKARRLDKIEEIVEELVEAIANLQESIGGLLPANEISPSLYSALCIAGYIAPNEAINELAKLQSKCQSRDVREKWHVAIALLHMHEEHYIKEENINLKCDPPKIIIMAMCTNCGYYSEAKTCLKCKNPVVFYSPLGNN